RATIPADTDEGEVELSATPAARKASGTARVRAEADGVRGEGRFDVTVEPAPLAKEVRNSIRMKLVLIPEGTFTMGSPKDEEDRKNEEEQHALEISRFYMGKYPV